MTRFPTAPRLALEAPVASSLVLSHRGCREQGYGGAFGVGKVTHPPADPGEQQCTLDEGKSRRRRLHDRAFWPSVGAEASRDDAFPSVEAPRRGGA